ncbi:MAG TPA: hypothetical protein VGL61_29580 [Kofleriaceae bacterium]
MKPLALVLAVSLAGGGCMQHPVATIATATTAIAFGGCAIDEVQVGDCALIGAISGVFFGGLAWLLYHYTDSSAHELKMDEAIGSNGTLQLHTFTPPPPVPLAVDAGVPDAPIAPIAPIASDAGIDAPAPVMNQAP